MSPSSESAPDQGGSRPGGGRAGGGRAGGGSSRRAGAGGGTGADGVGRGGGSGGRGGGSGGGSGVLSRTDGSRERPPEVPGVVLRARLRDAGAGRVWSGRVESTGAECTVRHLPLPPLGPARDDVLQAARRLAELRHPHLVAVTEVIPHDDGLAVLSQPVAGAISLSRLLGVRERIEPGEVVTVGLPMAQALAAAHAADFVHGSLSGEDILLEPNGRPVLAGVGMAGLLRLAGTPAGDVRDLADLLLDTMLEATGPDAAAVAVAVATALVDDPQQRPAADELAAALGRSCPPLAVRLVSEPITPLPMPPPPPGVDPSALSKRSKPAAEGDDVPGGTSSIGPAGARGVGPPRGTGRRTARGRFGPTTVPREVELLSLTAAEELPSASAADPPAVEAPVPDVPDVPHVSDAPVASLPAGRRDETTVPRPGPTGDPSAAPVAPESASASPADDSAAPQSLSQVDEPPAERIEATLLLRGTGSTTEPRRGARPVAGRRSAAAASSPSRARAQGGRGSASRGAGPPTNGAARPSRSGSGHSTRRPRVGARPRRSRWFLPATALAGVVVVAVTLLALTRGSSDSGTSNQAQPGTDSDTVTTATAGNTTGGGGVASDPVGSQRPEQRWQTELENLDAARAAAFQGADENALTLVFAPDSSALAQDTAAMRELVALGAHATGLRSVIDALEVLDEGPEVTVLRITDRQQPYSFVSADGTVLSERPAKPPQTREVTLVNTAEGWRIAQIKIVT